MRQHDLDPWSLVFGVAFLFVSSDYLIGHTADVHTHKLLALPAALIVVGFGVLGVAVRRMQRSEIGVDQRSEIGVDQRSEIDVDHDGGVV